MRLTLSLALSCLALLSACNEAKRPAPEQTEMGEDSAAAVVTPVPGNEPTMQVPVGPAPAGATDPATPTVRSADTCGATKAQARMNSLPSKDTLAAIRADVGHSRIRVIEPGAAVTMDYVPTRLNIEIGVDGRIKSIRCG